MTRSTPMHDTYHGVSYSFNVIEVATTYKDIDPPDWKTFRSKPDIQWKFDGASDVVINGVPILEHDFDPGKKLNFTSTLADAVRMIHAYIDLHFQLPD